MIYCTFLDSNGNENVLVLNKNDSKRNLNLNWFDNSWNSNYVFLLRKPLYINFLFQPPIIRPRSPILVERVAYCLLSSPLISQIIWRNTLSKSILPEAFISRDALFSRGA